MLMSMDDVRERFLESATQGFEGNHEQKHEAYAMLHGQVENSDPDSDPDQLVRATDALQKSPVQRKWWRRGLYLLVLLVSFPLAIQHTCNFLRGSGVAQMLSMPSLGSESNGEAVLTQHVSESDQLILFGDQSQTTESDQMKALWDSAPENPAYYIEYAMAYYQELGVLPSDFLEQSAQIDPGNGWYLTIHSAIESKEVVEKIKKPSSSGRPSRGWRGRGENYPGVLTEKQKEKKLDERSEWKVLDDKKYQEALAGLHRAAAMPGFSSHMRELYVQRTQILPKATDLVSEVALIAYAASTRVYNIHITYLSKVVLAEAYRCEVEHDTEALKRLIASWEVIAHGLNQDGFTLVDALISNAWMEGASLQFAEASNVCGMEKEAARFSAMHVVFKEMRNRRKRGNIAGSANDEDSLIERKGGMLHRMALSTSSRYVREPMALTDNDLKPGRMVDHSFVGRVMAATAWNLLLLMALVVWQYRYRRGAVVRIVSDRLTILFDRSDWLWLLGGGVLMPFCYYWVIQLWSPFSARAEGIYYSMFVQMIGQFVSMLVMMFVATALILRWRMMRWEGVFVVGKARWAWVMLACAASIPLVLGVATWSSSLFEPMLYLATGLGAVVGLWIVMVVGCWMFGRSERYLMRAIQSRILLPTYALAILLMAASVVINYHEEQYWVQKDWIFELSEDEPGFGRYEYRISMQLKKELAEILNRGESRKNG